MRKVIKKLIGLFALIVTVTLIGVSTKVNAAAYDYGTYRVSTGNSTNNTAKWDYTGCTTGKTFAVGDTTNGMVVEATTFKTHASGYLSITGGKWLIPVPADSSGILKVTDGNPGNTSRYYDMLDSESEVVEHSTIKATVEDGIAFSSSNIVTVSNQTYLRFQASGGELKCKSITITLTSGEFAPTATVYNVNYYSGANLIHTEEVEENSTIKYTPYKMGYDVEGLFTDSSLNTEFDTSTPITGDINLYVSFIEWDSSIYEDGNVLSLGLIAKYANGYTTNANNSVQLINTIYTLLPATGFEASSKTISTYGNSSYAIKTSGTFSSTNLKNGISITPTTDGTLSMYVYSSSARTCYMYDNSNAEIGSGQTTGSSTVTLISYDLTANETYNFGGSGSLYIYYASFAAAATAADSANLDANNSTGESTTMVGTTAVRVVGRITGVDELDIESIEATISGDSSVKKTFTTVYTAITNISGCEAADNTYYFYYTIYGVTDEYNGKTISFTYTVTFADGSVKTLATTNTYTIAL